MIAVRNIVVRRQNFCDPLREEGVEELVQTLSTPASSLRLVDSCITQLKAQGPSRTCNESKEEEEPRNPETRNLKPEIPNPETRSR